VLQLGVFEFYVREQSGDRRGIVDRRQRHVASSLIPVVQGNALSRPWAVKDSVSTHVQSVGLGLNIGGNVGGRIVRDRREPSSLRLQSGGKMRDWDSLVQADVPLYLLIANGINDGGEIVGFGVDGEGDVHGFLATPCELAGKDCDWCRQKDKGESAYLIDDTTPSNRRPVVSEKSREQLRHHMPYGMGGLGGPLTQQQQSEPFMPYRQQPS
jgi:hypothetical protein